MAEQGTRRRYRRLFAEGEGGSAGSSGGCFPDFYSPQDFQAWLQGNYQSARCLCCGAAISVTLSCCGSILLSVSPCHTDSQVALHAGPEYGSDGAINPIGIIFWIVHALGILSMGAF